MPYLLGRVMLTVRDATKLLSIHLGVDVVPYAARLVREEWLPRGGVAIDEYEAAHLLLAVAGSFDPSRSIEALERLKQVSIYSIDRATSTNAPKGLWTWQLATKETYNVAPVSAVDIVIEALFDGITIEWAVIDDGGHAATFEVVAAEQARFRINYAMRERRAAIGCRRLTQVYSTVISALADALHPEERKSTARSVSLELH